MTDTNLTQDEADCLIRMEKHRSNDKLTVFPYPGESVELPLHSLDQQEHFLIDLSRSKIDLAKVKMQNRGRLIIVLVRLDLGGAPHRNPDGEEMPTPHLHIYKEGFGDKWACSVPEEHFSDLSDISGTLDGFLLYCNVTVRPYIEMGLL